MSRTYRTSVPLVCETCKKTFYVKPSQLARGSGRGRFCSRQCLYNRPVETLAELFWPHVGPPLPSGCRLWTGHIGHGGYGVISSIRIDKTKRIHIGSHRVSWQINYGCIPNGLEVLHHCDNPPCVEPSHLFLGTKADNCYDKCSKGRQPSGEQHGNAFLTEKQVRLIRQRYATGKVYQKDLAAEFGVTQALISSIVRRAIWKNVE
jgi:hypothetical protein